MRRFALLSSAGPLLGCPQEPEPEPDDFPPICGDGVVEGSEACDDGEGNGPDANCLADCTANPIQSFTAGTDVIEEAEIDAVSVPGDGAWGDGAWCTSGTDDNGDGLVKFEIYYDPEYDLLDPEWGVESNLGPITIDDLAEVAYWTRPEVPAEPADFYLLVYTRPIAGEGGWYGSRLIAEPYLSRQPDAVGGDWRRWSTAPGGNELTFTDPDRTGSWGFAGQPTLEEIRFPDAFDWSQWNDAFEPTALDYGSESILYLAIHTDSGNPDFRGCVDGLEITLTDGRGFRLDLE